MGYDITVVLDSGLTETCLIMLINLAFSVHRIPQDVIHWSVKPQRLWPITKNKATNRREFFDKCNPKIGRPTLKYGSKTTKKKNVIVQCSSIGNERLSNVFQSLKIKWRVCVRAFASFLYKKYRCSPQGCNIAFFRMY